MAAPSRGLRRRIPSPSHPSRGCTHAPRLAEFAAELARCESQAALDHPVGGHVRLTESDLHAEPVHQPAERQRELVGVGASDELARFLALADDVGDQLALLVVEVKYASRTTGSGLASPHPHLHPQRPVAETARTEAGLFDQVNELVDRALALGLPLGQTFVEVAVGQVDRLLEQPVLGLEVVEDRRRARAGALGDVAIRVSNRPRSYSTSAAAAMICGFRRCSTLGRGLTSVPPSDPSRLELPLHGTDLLNP